MTPKKNNNSLIFPLYLARNVKETNQKIHNIHVNVQKDLFETQLLIELGLILMRFVLNVQGNRQFFKINVAARMLLIQFGRLMIQREICFNRLSRNVLIVLRMHIGI